MKAIIEVLWIGEEKPDLFSSLIQKFIGRNFSHNAILYKKTGKVWHATTPGGVCEDDLEVVLKDSVVRARKTVTLDISEESLEILFEAERGKPYAHLQNVGLLMSWFRSLLRDSGRSRNCSEFVANVLRYSEYRTQISPEVDWITPAETFDLLKPDLIVEIPDNPSGHEEEET